MHLRSKHHVGEDCILSLDCIIRTVNNTPPVPHALNIRHLFTVREILNSHRHAPISNSQPNNLFSVSSTMLKRIRRKLAAATRRKPPRAEVYAVPKSRLDSASDGSLSPRDSRKPLLSEKFHSQQEPRLSAKRGADSNHIAKSEDVSHLTLHHGEPHGNDVKSYPRPQVATQEIKPEKTLIKSPSHHSELEERDSSESEVMKFITIGKPGREVRALLLTPLMYQRIQALVHARQDLRATESELATTAAELNNLVVAKNELEEQDDCEVPGSFFDDDAYADRERRRLLLSTIEKKIGFCAKALEDLGRERPRCVAGVETQQKQYLDILERAVRDDRSADVLPLKVENPGNSAIWWTR